MNTHAFIAAQLAKPITHNVVTLFLDGTKRIHGTRSAGAAENYAIGERRKIGRDLINRETNATVHVLAVTIEAI